ncbi:MAG: MBL fold metallo-hydrolase [Desulfovibrionales bacterium]|nr:MBL fold metallo-hydrolase [Desulfovibrionales bacterium]
MNSRLPQWIVLGMFVLCFAASTSATSPRDYRFPREPGMTANGYPLPLTGKVLTKTPIVVKDSSAKLKQYPTLYFPGEETLDANEMRIVCIGSGNPMLRKGQAATGWVVELGNGDKFVFDFGGGTIGNLWSLGAAPAEFDKVFISHLHLDHVGGIFPLFDAMGWSRNTPLHVYGPSGKNKAQGTAAFVEHVQKASEWHIDSKRGIGPSDGMVMVAHEFDSKKFTKDTPRQLVYDHNGVTIYAFPVIHTIYGSVGYRLEWNGLSMAFTGDSEPSTLEAEQSKDVDVFIHEAFISAESFSQKNNVPMKIAENVVYGAHTTPAQLGQVFTIAKPVLGVATHYALDDDLVDPFFDGVSSTYNGPVVLAQDLTVINVTSQQIVTRMAMVDLLSWPVPAPQLKAKPTMEEPSKANRPDWITRTRISR